MKNKLITLSDKTKRKLSIQAINTDMSLKKYIEWILDKVADKKIEID